MKVMRVLVNQCESHAWKYSFQLLENYEISTRKIRGSRSYKYSKLLRERYASAYRSIPAAEPGNVPPSGGKVMLVNLVKVRMSNLDICRLYDGKLCDASRKKAIVGV